MQPEDPLPPIGFEGIYELRKGAIEFGIAREAAPNGPPEQPLRVQAGRGGGAAGGDDAAHGPLGLSIVLFFQTSGDRFQNFALKIDILMIFF